MSTSSKSFNGKLILEVYKQAELKAEIKSGWATLSQKACLKGLKTLVEAKLADGSIIPAGSVVYIKEETLHTAPWAKIRLKNETLPSEFILANINEVEYVEILEES